MCDKKQGNDLASGDGNCNVDSELNFYDHSSLSHGNVLSLELNSSRTPNVLHASVDSHCISWSSCLNKSHDDMLALSCGREKNASISSSLCVANNIEETRDSMGQDKVLIEASSNLSSSSSLGPNICLIARDSKVTYLQMANRWSQNNKQQNL
jgi:hypothetical protein